jgi:uncharacterized phage protein (TIGR01671 family)
MREIKFRAKVNGNYVYSDSYVNLAFYFDATSGYEQEQYTGLKDKNGKEVYEGDVLARTTRPNRYVIFKDGGFQTVSINNPSFINHINIDQFDVVVGNIYENPELIK